VTRWRRPGVNEILLVYLLLEAVGLTVNGMARGGSAQDQLAGFLISAFLVWRVSRGGWLSRAILIVGGGVASAEAALAVTRLWLLTDVALVAIWAVQVMLLLSPPVAARTGRPALVSVRAPGWARLVRRPPAWLLPSGLLAGVLLTLACLGHMDWTAVPGCRPSGSDACSAIAEGYPRYWLTANQGAPLILRHALVQDAVQWALASTSVLYLVWAWLTAPAGLPDEAEAEPEPEPAAAFEF
jgi:hypothetical protein